MRSRREDAEAIVLRLREAGHVAYFAGGCVRDTLLGLQPKDWDVATDAPPDRVRKLFPRTQAVGAAFGVILVHQGESVVEVATFRTDVSYEDGRRPTAVKFTTAEEDAKRRDFTINGLFFDPVENKVIDYVGGQEDLKNKVLRAIGEPDHRFDEDHLRLLRAVRFAARFGLTIEPVTSNAIARHAPQLKRISPERIAEELRLMLTPPTRVAAWTMLSEFALDDVIFRFLRIPWPAPRPEIRANRSTILIDRIRPQDRIDFGLALAGATLEYLAQRLPHLSEWSRIWNEITVRQMVRAAREALRVSNEELDAVEGTLSGTELMLKWTSPSVAELKRFLARPTSRSSRDLIAALPDGLGDRDRLVRWEQRVRELEETEFAPAPLITGDDLTAEGFQPGPMFKRVLNEVYDAQLEDRVKARGEALALARKLFARG